MANLLEEENREENTWTKTPAEDKIKKMNGEDTPVVEQPKGRPERFSVEDISANFDTFRQEDVDAMSDEQYANYEREAERRGLKKTQAEKNSDNLGKNLELADKLGTMADFVIKETEGDEDYAEDFKAATAAKDFLTNKTSKFTGLSDKDRDLFTASLGKMYEDVKQRRGHFDNAIDQFVKGYWSTGNMLYQGGLALKPGELTQEDAENISASVRDSERMDLERPSRVGAVEDIHSVGDAVDYVLGAVGENAVRGVVATGAAAAGAIALPAIGVGAGLGAIVGGTLGTMALNTGEAVQDQINEGRDDGDIRNTRGWAIAQGTGYSLLDGAFGVSAWGAKLWSNMLRKAGLGQLTKMAKGAAVEAAAETARKASLKEVGKDVLLHGVLGEGAQEAAQSQGVGRGIRYLQAGSIFKTKEDGTPETVGDAFLEAVNEFAGGAAAGLTFGLLGGGMSHVDASRSVKKWNAMFDALNEDKTYQKLDNYGKLLVKRHLMNDAFLTTELGIPKEVADSLVQSNKEIDAEIDRMSDNKKDPNERLIGQSAKTYLDIFKSQYSLEDMDAVVSSDEAKGFESNVNVEEMAGSGRRLFDNGKQTGVQYTDPNTGISIVQLTDENGKATGRYVFNNDPSRKSPVFGKDEIVCKSLEEAIDKARKLDIYNQWRERKLDQKATVVKSVVDKLFGSRGVQLHFVDRPTKGGVLPGTSPAGIRFDEEGNGHLYVSLDAMDSVGKMYGAFVHERSHQDIVEFLLQSGKWTKEIGGKRVIDWNAFENDREALFAKVDGAEEASAQYRDKDAKKDEKTGHYNATHEWGKSAGIAGEEMTVTLNSARQLAERLRYAERGIFGSLEDKIRQAIGMKMAYELGLDPQAILPSDVTEEMRNIFRLNYFNEESSGATGEGVPTREVQPESGAVQTPEQFAARFGKKESPTVDANDELNLGEENLADIGAEDAAEKPAPKKTEKPSVKATKTSVDAEGNAHVTVEKTENGKTVSEERTITPKGEVKTKQTEAKETVKPAENAKPTEAKTEKPVEKAEKPSDEKAKTSEPTKETVEAPKAEKPVSAAPAKEAASKTEAITPKTVEKKVEPKAEPKAEKPTAAKETAAKTEPSVSKTEPKEPVIVNPKEDTVTIPQDNAKPRSMPKKTKAAVVKQLGINQKLITPEVEDRWVRLNDLPEGTKIKVGGKAYVKGESLGANKDTVWYSSDKRKHTQTMLARIGEFNVVENKAPETASKPKTEKKSESAKKPVKKTEAKVEKESFDLTDEEIANMVLGELGITTEETAKPVEAAKEEKPAEATEPVRVNKNEELTVEQQKREAEIDEALDAFGKFTTEEQRNVIKSLSRQYGDVTDIHEAPAVKGHTVVVIGSETKIIKPDGNVMTQQEIDEAIAKRDNPSPSMVETTFRAISILKMPQLSSVNAMEADNDKRYNTLSEDRLLYLAAHDDDMMALRELFLGRFVKKPPKRLNGGLVQWFRDKGVENNEIDGWLTKTWHAVLAAMHEGSRLDIGRESAKREVQRIENALALAKSASERAKKAKKPEDLANDPIVQAIRDQIVAMTGRSELAYSYEGKSKVGNGSLNFAASPFTKDEIDTANEVARALSDRIETLTKSGKLQRFIDADPAVVSLRETLKMFNGTIARFSPSGVSDEIRSAVESLRKQKKNTSDSLNPLGTKVSAESFIYSIVNDLWSRKEAADYFASEKKRIADETRRATERENERLAQIDREDRAKAFATGKDVATVRKERMIAESRIIPERYKQMSDKELVRICVPHDGIPADQMARQEIVLRAYEALLKNDIAGKLKTNNIGDSAYGDIIDETIDEIDKKISDGTILETFSGENNTATFSKFAVSIANRKISAKRESVMNDPASLSYEGLQAEAGSAVDSYANEQERALETDDAFVEANDIASVGPSDKSDAEKRVAQGLFGSAQEAAIALINSKALTKNQSNTLRALVSAWSKKVNDAYRDLDEARKIKGVHGNRLNALEKRLKEAMELGSTDESVIEIAAESLGLKPRVYQGRLAQLLDALELAFLGKDNYEAARRNSPMGRRFVRIRSNFAKGLFGNAELSWSTVQDVKNLDNQNILGYDEDELVGLMYRNGDVAMAKVVSMARDGKSDSEIQSAIDKSELLRENGKNVPNEAGVWTALSLLNRAYTDYGWIDTRIFDTKRKVYSEKQKVTIVEKVLDTFGNESDFALGEDETSLDAIKSGRFKELVGKVRVWLGITGANIPLAEMPHLLVRAIRNRIANNPLTQAQATAKNKVLQTSDHEIVSKMMADNGNNEDAVQKALTDSGEDAKRVKSMMTHYRAVEKANAEKAKRAEEAAKRAVEKAAEEAAKVTKAEPEKPKTNDDIVKSLPFSDKKSLLAKLAAGTGDSFMSNDDLIAFATEKMGMGKLMANMAVNAIRPVSTTPTDSELRARGEKVASSQFMDEREADRINEKIKEEDSAEERSESEAELAKAEKQLSGVPQKAKKDSESIKEAIAAVGKPNVGDLLRRKGLSKERAEEMVRNWLNVSNLETEIEKLRNKIAANRSTRAISITFDVNYGRTNERVRVSGNTPKQLIRNALHAACGGQYWRYHDIELQPVTVDGRVSSIFGKITSDDLNRPDRLAAFSKAFGYERPVRPDGASVRAPNREGVSATNVGVAGGASGAERPGVGGDVGISVRPGIGRSGPRVEPVGEEDPGEVQRWRHNNGVDRTARWITLGVSDTNAYFGAQKSAEAHGFDVPKHERVKSVVTDREANDLVSRPDDFAKVVAKAHRGEPLSDVEVRAMTLAIGTKLANGINGHLNSDEFEGNEARLNELVQAILRAGSTLGSALNQLKHGVDLRTRDTNVWIKAQVKAKLEKELADRYGPSAPVDHAAEIEAKLSELQKTIDEQSAELQERHDRIEELQKKVAEKESAADDKTIERVRKEAYGEGYRHGEIHAVEEEKKRARETLAGMQERLGDKIGDVEMARRFVGVSRLASDIFGATLRHAGNPEIALTDEMRDFFATALATAKDNDPDIAREIMRDSMSDYDAKVDPYFNLYLEELRKVSVPKDGSRETEKKNRRRVVRERAQSVPDATAEADVSEILDENPTQSTKPADSESAPTAQPSTRKRVKRSVGTGSTFLDRLRKRALRAHEAAILAEGDEAEVLNNIGEYARTWFKLSAILKPNQSTDEKITALVTTMNRLVNGYDSFDRSDAKDALLGRGVFKPLSRGWAQASLGQLRKAMKLAEAGKVEEAAKAVGIKNVSDAEILQELDRRIGNLLNQKLNALESRLNEADNTELANEVRNLIIALNDIRSGKPVGDLLAKYLSLAVGTKDYRRQQSVLERIRSRISMYERKIAENDFEPAPKRERVDSADELREIQHEMRNLEKLREKYKHARDAWRVSNKPLLSRGVSSILEILGETKAVVGSMDLSSMLRQGGQLTWAHPLLFAKNFKKTLRIFFSKGDKYAEAAMNEIWDRPNADYYRRAGIDFTDWGSNAANADDRFLLNQYRNFTKWKLLRLGIESSERAFSMFLNMMRADVFDAMVANSTFRSAENMTDEQLKAIGNFINIASQRGAIDKQGAVGKAIPALNAVLWSPRNVISRFQFIKETIMLPLHGVSSAYGAAANDGKMRAMFAKETLRYFAGVGAAVLFTKMMADLFRDDDEPEQDLVLDPTSSDFLKVKYGNTRIDFLSGLQQIFVFSSRALTHKTTNLRGETTEMTNPSDYYALFARFARSKFSPAASIIFDTMVARETYDRQEVSYDWREQLANDKEKVGVTRYAIENVFFPLTFRDMREQLAHSPIGFAPISWALTTLGAGVQAFDPYTYKQMSSDYRYFKRLFNDSATQQERDELIAKHPMLKRMGPIDSQIKYVEKIKRDIKAIEKKGGNADILRDALEREQKRAINLMAGFSHPMETE